MQESQKITQKSISSKQDVPNNPLTDTAVSDMHTLLGAIQPGAIAQRKLQDHASNQSSRQLGVYQRMADANTRVETANKSAKRNPGDHVLARQPVQLAKEEIYSHTEDDMTRIKAAAERQGVGGLCHAWTVDWIRKKIAGQDVTAKYTDRQLDQLALQQKQYYKRTNLEAPNALEGFDLNIISNGRSNYHAPLEGINEVAVQPGTGYYLSMGEGKLGEDSQGHAIAIYAEADKITVMDQNKGQFTLSNMGELAGEYRNFIQEVYDQSDDTILFREWRLYQMVPKAAKDDACCLPCFITTACVIACGLPDDCEELTVLRKFRDEYVALQPNGEKLVDFYYFYSPRIVTKLNKHRHSRRLYDQLYLVIRYCVNQIKKNELQKAMDAYIEMCLVLQKKFVDADWRADPAKLEALLMQA